MKTTIDLDEKKLLNVMKLKGFKTRKEAVDYAITEAERRAKVDSFLAKKWDVDAMANALDPNYDYRKLRDLDKPSYVRHRR